MKMMTPGNKPQNQGVEMFGELAMEFLYPTAPTGRDEDTSGGRPNAVPLLDGFCFQNAANCPDCDGGMVKQGACFSCPTCGFSACA
ncbi:MAG: hypothetical protein ACREBV_04395 [Candidatus Zixiibacteriota bacterium]